MTTAILVSRDDTRSSHSFLSDLRNSQEEDVYVWPAGPRYLLTVVATSGTTGYSKFVPRSHKEIIDCEMIMDKYIRPDVTLENVNEKTFCYYSDRMLGWTLGITFSPVILAASRVLLDRYYPESAAAGIDMWDVITREEITLCSMMCLELNELSERTESVAGARHKLKKIITGGQPLSQKQIQQFLQLSEQLVILYGTTETCHLTARTIDRDQEVTSTHSGQKLDGVQLRLLNDAGEPCQVYETGTIECTGPVLFKGYFNLLEHPDPQTLAAFTSDGWYKTGDYGHVDEGGNLAVFGRRNDVIVFGPQLFYPGWMEKKLAEHPDILEAVIVPVSDPVMYQHICVCVKVKKDGQLDEGQVRKQCADAVLPNAISTYSPSPKYFIITKEDFPRTTTGKPNKQRLRQMAEEMFGAKARQISSDHVTQPLQNNIPL